MREYDIDTENQAEHANLLHGWPSGKWSRFIVCAVSPASGHPYRGIHDRKDAVDEDVNADSAAEFDDAAKPW